MKRSPARPARRSVNLRIRDDLLEALDETAEELVVGRNRLVEIALESYLSRLDLPVRRPRTPGDHAGEDTG